MRAECQEAETAVSFLRRMAQGRLDLVHACLDHHDGDNLDTLVERLPRSSARGPPARPATGACPRRCHPTSTRRTSPPRSTPCSTPITSARSRPWTEAELRQVGERLTAIETRVSDQRRALHERIDTLQAEIVSRYKTGEASVDGLLA